VTATWRRRHDGMWEAYVNDLPRPTRAELAAHAAPYKQFTPQQLRVRGLEADCLLCKKEYDLPSAFDSIRTHGVCEHCYMFLRGKLAGVHLTRRPTIEEAMAVPDKRTFDTLVILDAYKALLKRVEAL
jgi:hypothetical protein